jgi:hypothetical protein
MSEPFDPTRDVTQAVAPAVPAPASPAPAAPAPAPVAEPPVGATAAVGSAAAVGAEPPVEPTAAVGAVPAPVAEPPVEAATQPVVFSPAAERRPAWAEVAVESDAENVAPPTPRSWQTGSGGAAAWSPSSSPHPWAPP